jgi:putative ABC transport system substrate-binding protein
MMADQETPPQKGSRTMLPRRRAMTGCLVALAAALPLRAHSAGRPRRVGVLCHELPTDFITKSLSPRLAQLGHEEGRDYVFEIRSSQGEPGRIAALAAELVALPVDLIVAPLNREILAAKAATRTIPILMMYAVLPVETGLVASLARPGANVTGTTTLEPELMGKQVEAFRAAVPGLRRVVSLFETGFPGIQAYVRVLQRAAQALSVQWDLLAVNDATELPAVLAAVERNRPDGLYLSATGPLITHSQQVVDFALEARLPLMTSIDWVGRPRAPLLAYAPNFAAMMERNAWMIDRLFKGVRPADIPVELPARYRLRVNLKTARAIGLNLPQAFLVRVDELVE